MTDAWTLPVMLAGRHVRLEPLRAEHADGLRLALADGELWRLWYTAVPAPEGVEAYIATALEGQEGGDMLPFAVFDHDGAIVGCTRYCNIAASNRRLEIGYTWYARRVQRTGLNTEAKRLLLGHAFDAMGCSVVELRTHVMNHRSRAAIERLGAHFDGILRRQMRMPDGHLRDTAVYSILDTEWPVVRRGLDFKLEHGGRA